MIHHPEVSTWLTWHETWMITWYDMWIMMWHETSSPSFLHRPLIVSLGRPEHLVKSTNTRPLTIDDLSCLIGNLCWVNWHLTIDHQQFFFATKNTSLNRPTRPSAIGNFPWPTLTLRKILINLGHRSPIGKWSRQLIYQTSSNSTDARSLAINCQIFIFIEWNSSPLWLTQPSVVDRFSWKISTKSSMNLNHRSPSQDDIDHWLGPTPKWMKPYKFLNLSKWILVVDHKIKQDLGRRFTKLPATL